MEVIRATSVVDTHTGGEPTRIIIGGGPYLPGRTISEKWAYMKEHMTDFRNFVMHEPRGHSDMFGAFLTPPKRRALTTGSSSWTPAMVSPCAVTAP